MFAKLPSFLSPCSAVPANKSLLIDAAIVAALLAVGAAGYYYSPLLLPKTDAAATPDAACDLHRNACGAALPGGGRIELSLLPHPIPNVQPIQAEVRVAGAQARKVTLDLAGEKMNMGVNRTELEDKGNGLFTGTTSLPVCVTGAMAWRATLVVETARERISVPYRFESQPH